MGKVAPATVSNEFRALRSFYGWLFEDGELDVNPAARLRGPRGPETSVTHERRLLIVDLLVVPTSMSKINSRFILGESHLIGNQVVSEGASSPHSSS